MMNDAQKYSVDGLFVGLLGGSFNPAHEGHREISSEALDALRLDAVWWLVSPQNPLKDADLYAPYEERLREARLVARHPRIVVSNFEARRGLQYTVDTLTALTARDPETRFVFLMGADSFANFHKWRDWREIATLAAIAVFNRPGYGPGEENDCLESPAATALSAFRVDENRAQELRALEPPRWVFMSGTRNPISSTRIRASRNS